MAGCGSLGGGPSKADKVSLAQCLSNNGAVFYGAHWCNHCSNQKAMFGAEALEFVNYVECADEVNDPQGAQACKLAGVTGYPTWKFANGTSLQGVQSLERLAETAGCMVGDLDEDDAVDAGVSETEDENLIEDDLLDEDDIDNDEEEIDSHDEEFDADSEDTELDLDQDVEDEADLEADADSSEDLIE